MTHAERLRIFADMAIDTARADLLAGAAALEAMEPRRITADPATWPEEGVVVRLWREDKWVDADREGQWWAWENGRWEVTAKVCAGDIWLPMPPKPEMTLGT